MNICVFFYLAIEFFFCNDVKNVYRDCVAEKVGERGRRRNRVRKEGCIQHNTIPYENGSEGSGNIRPGYVLNPNSTYFPVSFSLPSPNTNPTVTSPNKTSLHCWLIYILLIFLSIIYYLYIFYF
jgi:hypothetical protein